MVNNSNSRSIINKHIDAWLKDADATDIRHERTFSTLLIDHDTINLHTNGRASSNSPISYLSQLTAYYDPKGPTRFHYNVSIVDKPNYPVEIDLRRRFLQVQTELFTKETVKRILYGVHDWMDILANAIRTGRSPRIVNAGRHGFMYDLERAMVMSYNEHNRHTFALSEKCDIILVNVWKVLPMRESVEFHAEGEWYDEHDSILDDFEYSDEY